MEQLIGIPEIIRAGYFESYQVIRQRIQARRFPKPMRVGGKLKWRVSVVEAWFRDGSVMWIERTNKP